MQPADSGLEDLIARAARLEPAAYDELIHRYSRRLYGYFFRMTGSPQLAEDLLQEVFVRLVRMLPAYEHKDRFEPWLFRIAANLARDQARRKKASPIQLARNLPQDAPSSDPADLAPPPHHAVATDEDAGELQQALHQLEPADREILILRHFADMSFKQIAELLSIPLGTALARAHRALAKLRNLMQTEGSQPA